MSEWREEEPEPEPRDWDDIKRKGLAGACLACLVIAWMVFARPGDELQSSRGFNMGGGGPASSGGRPFETRPKTGLDMVSAQIGDGPDGVTAGVYAGMQQDAALSGAQTNPPQEPVAASAPPAAAPAPAGAAPAGNPPGQTATAAEEAAALKAGGIPSDPKSLTNLGAKDGLLTALAEKLLDHPKILAAVFNNKMVVDAFMSRPGAKENCENAGALKSYLSDSSKGGLNDVLPLLQKVMSKPATASALVSALSGTEMVKRASSCPSLSELSKDPTAAVTVAMANPKALGLVMDPRGAAALASNPQAAGVLAGVTSKLGGLGGLGGSK